MHLALSRARFSLTSAMRCSGEGWEPARDRIRVKVMLMNNEAGTPLSDTSPMMKHRCLSSSMKKSYKSPPTSRAGTRLAASENRPAATSGGRGLGRNPIWISVAALSSPSRRSRLDVASISSRTRDRSVLSMNISELARLAISPPCLPSARAASRGVGRASSMKSCSGSLRA